MNRSALHSGKLSFVSALRCVGMRKSHTFGQHSLTEVLEVSHLVDLMADLMVVDGSVLGRT